MEFAILAIVALIVLFQYLSLAMYANSLRRPEPTRYTQVFITKAPDQTKIYLHSAPSRDTIKGKVLPFKPRQSPNFKDKK